MGYRIIEKCMWSNDEKNKDAMLTGSPDVEMEFFFEKDENFCAEVLFGSRFNTRTLNSCVDES